MQVFKKVLPTAVNASEMIPVCGEHLDECLKNFISSLTFLTLPTIISLIDPNGFKFCSFLIGVISQELKISFNEQGKQ